MIGASKILTVSYGTFSCTLEGFDEPFNTMKAIAEYFRDLAAEDRYFGAEPPTPDAAMLHKIAEREIHRRVEAKIQENGVILRAGEAIDAPAPAVAAAPALAAPTDYDDQPLLSDAAVSADSVAAKLSKLRASAAASVVATAGPEIAAETYSEDQHADDLLIHAVINDAPIAKPPAVLIADQIETIENVDQAPAESDFSAKTDTEAPSADLALADPEVKAELTEPAEALIATDTNDEDIADQFEATDDLNEIIDQDAQEELARMDGVLSDDEGQADLTTIADHLDAQAVQAVEPERQDDAPAHIDAAISDAPSADTLAADDALLASLGTLINKVDHPDRTILDDEFEDEFDGYEDSFAEDALWEDEPASLRSGQTGALAGTDAAFADDIADDDADPAVVQRARARVIKIRRVDAPAFAADPAPQPQPRPLSEEAEAALMEELAALEAEIAPASAPTPSQPAEAHDAAFDAELAGIAAEIAADPAPVRPHRPVRSIAVARPAQAATAVTSHAAPAASEETLVSQTITARDAATDDVADLRHDIEGDLADEAVGRLMAQTNHALDGADIKRRQSAIAHLKAAVAATEADRLVAPSPPKDTLIDSYRSDLESVVRPSNVRGADSRVANADRPQPLVLVSAQRIDRLPRSENMPRPEGAPRIVLPVRPRRVAMGAMAAVQQDSLLGSAEDDLDEDEGLDDAAVNMFAETESFADFADRLGASDLPDLLEAAAVYCASVLGRPEFSRPLVLRQISTLPATADLSREDGLRVFGTLLRQGRIAKTRRGQFAVTDRSPILAEALRSAG